MKKIITLILALGMIISVTACGNSNANTGGSSSEGKKDTTSISEKKEETKKDKEDEKYGYIYYRLFDITFIRIINSSFGTFIVLFYKVKCIFQVWGIFMKFIK